MRKVYLLLLGMILFFALSLPLCAAPCYGTKLPEKKKVFMGLQSHSIFKRYLEDNFGKVRSAQYFLLLSYGVFDWLSVDLKGGAGDIKHHPVGSSEVDYSTSFAGGYGLRLKFLDKKMLKMAFGFQHISVHPKGKEVSGIKNRVILDDWQTSLLASFDFKKFTPYLGMRWSRIDLIHKEAGARWRKMSEASKSYGLILGFDLPVTKKIWLNFEGSFFDSEAAAFSVNYSF